MKTQLQTLKAQGVYLGTSSWKYPGWKGLVYHRTYRSEKDFAERCLSEYAETFPAVGVDHTYYAWPLESTFTKYTENTPKDFLFALKATEAVTVFKYPTLKRYGKLAGQLNPDFLNAEAFLKNFSQPLEKFQTRLAPVLLEFSQFYPGMLASGGEFVDRLGKFLVTVRQHSPLAFAVEMRNANWLKPDYFETLLKNSVGHVFNSWTRMPAVTTQLQLTEGLDLPFLVARLLLEPGVTYETAVEAFAPYDKIQAPQPEVRAAAVALIQRALKQGLRAFVFVNNRCEGSAPKTIEAILEGLNQTNPGEG